MSDECHINFNCSCKNFDVPDNDDPVAPSREVTAEVKTLPAGSPATAEVISDQTGTRFIFGIPAGEQGPPGEKGDKGDPGEQGDYTAFEVYAHDTDIPVGESAELGGYVTEVIPASMECRFVIRSITSPETSDVMIDWGDETVQPIYSCVESSNDKADEFISMVHHKYATPGKYIIKIFGRDYFSFCSARAYSVWKEYNTSNLMCRVFEKDLPIASHIQCLSSVAHTSQHLLNIHAGYSLNGKYLAYAFKNCRNLLNADGFGLTTDPDSVYDAFSGCVALVHSTLRIPAVVSDPTTGVNGVYAFCGKLKMDVEDLLPLNGFSGKSINIENTFVNCKLLAGSVPSHFLWNDQNIIFTNTEQTFKGCSNTIRAQVPVSWGGTNTGEEARIKVLRDGDLNDYTAFEVYAHDTDIPVGELAEPHLSYIGKAGDTIAVAVPAAMTHKFIIRSEVPQSKQDVVVDWGDGTTTALRDVEPTILGDGAEYRYTVEHTYTATRTYIVKIFGKAYFSFMNGGEITQNLLCRIFDIDLPVATWIWNFSSSCRETNHLLHVNFYCHAVNRQAINWSNTFLGSRNLLSVYGFSQYNNQYTVCTQIFTNARALIATDFRLCPYPRTENANAGSFIKCTKLVADINDLLPVNGFKSGSTIDLRQAFWGCTKITGRVPAELLWEDTTINWINTEETFEGCSDEIRAQVPTSWGGTASDSIIPLSLEDRIKALEARCAALEV